MVPLNQKLARKGRSANLVGLRQQWRASVELSRRHAAALNDAGWGLEQTDELERSGRQLDSARSATLELRGAKQRKTRTEVEKRQDAKRLIRRMRNALPSVLKKLPKDDAELAGKAFLAGTKLGDSTPLLLEYLQKISGPAQRLAPHFRRFNEGRCIHEDIVAVVEELGQTDAEQEVARGALPADTLAFHEHKGYVLEQVEELNRLAKNAFDGQAHMIGQFNKDLYLRAVRQRALPSPEEAEPEVNAG